MFFRHRSKLYCGDAMNVVWYLLFYSLLGFLGEVLYARLTHSKKPDRKCRLFLPLCPVYGIGATLIALLPRTITGRPLLYFLVAAGIASGVEYALSVFYEKVWGVTFWDYSQLPGNLHGRICLPFTILWGGLSLVLLPILHPIAQRLAGLLPDVLTLPVGLLLVVDFLLTGALLRSSHDTDALIWYR